MLQIKQETHFKSKNLSASKKNKTTKKKPNPNNWQLSSCTDINLFSEDLQTKSFPAWEPYLFGSLMWSLPLVLLNGSASKNDMKATQRRRG